jgi:hypothetical protein
MKDLAGLHFRLAVLYALCAFALGNVMGARHDFSLQTVHAHLNLLGWVSVALYGVYLRLHPAAAATRLARVHFFLAHAGFLCMILGLVLIYTGSPEDGTPFAAFGGALSFLAMALFALVVFRTAPAVAAR